MKHLNEMRWHPLGALRLSDQAACLLETQGTSLPPGRFGYHDLVLPEGPQSSAITESDLPGIFSETHKQKPKKGCSPVNPSLGSTYYVHWSYAVGVPCEGGTLCRCGNWAFGSKWLIKVHRAGGEWGAGVECLTPKSFPLHCNAASKVQFMGRGGAFPGRPQIICKQRGWQCGPWKQPAPGNTQ